MTGGRDQLWTRLRDFQTTNGVTSKGSLSVVVQLTESVSQSSPPWNSTDFVANSQGQVAGLSGTRLQRILAGHGITRTLAVEGGRTSRGSLDLMAKYIGLANDLSSEGLLDLPSVQEFWINSVRSYFNNLPFMLTADTGRTLTSHFDDLFEQVRRRQTETPGTQQLGAVLQHLVGGKLRVLLKDAAPASHGASVADAPTDRGGDFIVNDVIIHCTTAPGGSLITKCAQNLASGSRPVIITLFERVHTALDLAADAGLAGRVEVWGIQQFLTTNVHEWSAFDKGVQSAKLTEIIDAYNDLVAVEHDPSLRIVLA